MGFRVLFWIVLVLIGAIIWSILINGFKSNTESNIIFKDKSDRESNNISKRDLIDDLKLISYPSPYVLSSLPINKLLRSPVGTESGSFYYNAQKFLDKNNNVYHLGEDLNGLGGNDTDFGDKVFSIGMGRVIYTGEPSSGWGKVILTLHKLEKDNYILALYAHLSKISVLVDDHVYYGQNIGEIGNAKGKYFSHLHFEIFKTYTLDIGGGYDRSLDEIIKSRTNLENLVKKGWIEKISNSDEEHFDSILTQIFFNKDLSKESIIKIN